MRRKQKRRIELSVILILCMAIAGLVLAKRNRGTDPGRTEVKKTLVMAVEAPLDAPYGKLAMAYKENVEEMSGGSLSIDIYENGLLGRSAELISSIGDGSNEVDIMLAPVRDLVDAGCPDTGKLLEPYSFDGHAGFLKWASSREAETLLEEPEKTGLGARGLFFAEDGFSHLFLKENRISVRGKRVAGEANDESAEYVDRIGGIYDYLPSVDIRDALLSGTLDGVERDCRFYQEDALWEAAPYIVADSHLVSPCEALIKLGSVEKLSAEELDILKEAGKTAVEAFTEKLRQEEKDMLDEFTGHGAEVVNPRERAELMARIKHLADYSKEDSKNPDYREKGYIYTEEMYYKLTGATELPDDWTDRMGPLMRGLIKEEDHFVETPQTDDGEMQEQWQPDEGIDTAVYQSCTGEVMPGALGAVQAAQRRLGYPYSQARRDSGIAYDCSSLVYWSYLEAGVNIDPAGGHTAADIAHYLESTGRDISGSDLRPGDLIFYSYKRNGRYKNISHVAMVAGDGMIVHASSSRKMVVMSGLTLERAVAVARPVMEGRTEDLAAPETKKETEEELSQEVRPADYGPGTQESQDAGESAPEETGGAEYQESVPESMASTALH